MKKFKTEELLEELKADVQQIIAAATFIKQTEKSKLVYQVEKDQWSIVQVLEHLNMYNRYYLPAIDQAMTEHTSTRNAWFNSGRLGNYFTNSMKPGNVYEIKNKMKTFKAYHPANSLNVDKVFNEFLEQQNTLLQLLEVAKNKDLNAIEVPISISRFIKLKLGDIFRFVIAHEQRHMIQARNTMKAMGFATDKFPVILQVVAQ